MLGAIDLRRFRQNRRTAVAYHQIHRCPQSRVGGDPRIAIRTTALQAHSEVSGRHIAALLTVHRRQHCLHQRDSPLHGFTGTARFLDHQAGLEYCRTIGQLLHQRGQLVDFTPQANHQHTGKIHMICIAAKGALEDLDAIALGAHATAAAVGDCNHTVHIGVIAQVAGIERRSDLLTHRGRTIDAGNDPDVIARAHSAIGTDIAVEENVVVFENSGLVDVGQRVSRTARGHIKVVHMDVVTGLHDGGGLADDLTVFANRLPASHTAQGNLVARRNVGQGDDGQAVGMQDLTFGDIAACDCDVIAACQYQ